MISNNVAKEVRIATTVIGCTPRSMACLPKIGIILGTGLGGLTEDISADAGALDVMAGRLEKAGVKVARLDRAGCAHRRIADGVSLSDPSGNRLEIRDKTWQAIGEPTTTIAGSCGRWRSW